MKVLHFVCSPGYRKAGADNAARLLCEEQQRQGISATLLSMSDPKGTHSLVSLPLIPAKYSSFLTTFTNLKEKIEHYDMIHVHNVYPTFAVRKIVGLAQKAHMPTVFSPHGIVEITSIAERFSLNPLQVVVYRQLVLGQLTNALKGVSALALSTSRDLQILKDKLKFIPNNYEIVGNGVHPRMLVASQNLPDVREKFGITENYILFVGNLKYNKGVEFLIAAAANVPGQVVVVGRATRQDYARKLYQLTEDLELQNKVIFTGFVEFDELKALYQNCTVFCLPTLADTLPLVILDAMASKKPVVSTAVGGIPEEVINGKTGLLIEPQKVEELSKALTELVQDKDKARTYGEAGFRHLMKNYTWPKVAQKTLGLYGKILNNG